MGVNYSCGKLMLVAPLETVVYSLRNQAPLKLKYEDPAKCRP